MVKKLIAAVSVVFSIYLGYSFYLKYNLDARMGSLNKDGYGREYFGNYKLTDQDGLDLRFFDDVLKDKIVLINFIYTTCGSSCPLETARIKKVANLLGDKLGKEIFFYSISVDPENDSVEMLKHYHKRFGLSDSWKFLRGEKRDIEEILKKFGAFSGELNRKNIEDHSLSVMVGNQRTNHWVRRHHLEDANVLATLLESLNPKKKESKLKDYADAPLRLREISRGENLFYTRCNDCHSIGQGKGIGPDLYNITKNREEKWLRRWIKEPDKMLEEKDPISVSLFEAYDKVPMPNLKLSDVDVDALIKYLSEESEKIKKEKVNK
jgi:protein SCO1/2